MVTSSLTQPLQVTELHTQLLRAVAAGRARAFILPRLEQLAELAPKGSEAWQFAEQELAEMQLQQAPWRAALHARRLAVACPRNDVGHSLYALAQMIQGNHRAAIASYRRAVALRPQNPWYLHNLGHLLDVTQNAPREGLSYLRKAHTLLNTDIEIAASLIHCLAQTGDRTQALALLEHTHTQHLKIAGANMASLIELRTWLNA